MITKGRLFWAIFVYLLRIHSPPFVPEITHSDGPADDGGGHGAENPGDVLFTNTRGLGKCSLQVSEKYEKLRFKLQNYTRLLTIHASKLKRLLVVIMKMC